MDEEDEEERALRLALEMSLVSSPPESKTSEDTSTSAAMEVDAGTALLDADLVNQLLGSVDADPNDPIIQAALQQLNSGKKKAEDSSDKDDTKKRKQG